MHASLDDFIAASLFSTRELLLFSCPEPAGLPSPADDQLHSPFSLTQHLFRNPASTFLVRFIASLRYTAGWDEL